MHLERHVHYFVHTTQVLKPWLFTTSIYLADIASCLAKYDTSSRRDVGGSGKRLAEFVFRQL